MKNYKDNLLGALYMLKKALNDYDLEISHNILIGGGTDESEEQQEQNLCEYLDTLDVIIKETWLMEGNPVLFNMKGEQLSK
jgi:hypothetical protein